MKKTIGLVLIASCVAFAEVGAVKKIIDGDTIDIGNDRCRFAYIDTHESKANSRLKTKLESCTGITVDSMTRAGKDSKEFLNNLVEKGVSYKYEVISKDRYNRAVCEIYVNGEMLNLKMVDSGYAVPYYQYIPLSKRAAFKKASQEAKRLNKGLYKTNSSAIKCIEN